MMSPERPGPDRLGPQYCHKKRQKNYKVYSNSNCVYFVVKSTGMLIKYMSQYGSAEIMNLESWHIDVSVNH